MTQQANGNGHSDACADTAPDNAARAGGDEYAATDARRAHGAEWLDCDNRPAKQQYGRWFA